MKTIFEHISEIDVHTIEGRVVFTNGCFDILHAGHVRYLHKAKSLGDVLVVGLNSDSSVSNLKGSSRPLNTWSDRATVLAALSSVDLVIGFGEDTPLELIKKIHPDFITKGGDYVIEEMIGKDFVESYGGKVIVLPYDEGYSTTELVKKIRG